MRARAFTFLEFLITVSVLIVLLTVLAPVVRNAQLEASIEQSHRRLSRLHQSLTVYRSDWDAAEIHLTLPPQDFVYGTYFGLGEDFFRSPCGYRGIIPSVKELGYQYSWDETPELKSYLSQSGERSVIFTDASCNESRAIWESPAAKKTGLAVRLDGSLVRVNRRGIPFVFAWWGE